MMNAAGVSSIHRLYARLARIALDLDELALELAAAGLSYEQAEGMDVPIAHLALGVEALEDALCRAQKLDQSHRGHDLAIDRELLAASRQPRHPSTAAVGRPRPIAA